MTDLEILKKAITDLGAISVPNLLLEQIALPIYNVRQSLIGLLNAINKQQKEESSEDVEVISVDMDPEEEISSESEN